MFKKFERVLIIRHIKCFDNFLVKIFWCLLCIAFFKLKSVELFSDFSDININQSILENSSKGELRKVGWVLPSTIGIIMTRDNFFGSVTPCYTIIGHC